MIEIIGLQQLSEIKQLFLDVFSQEPWNDKWESDQQATAYVLDLIDNRNSLAIGYYLDGRLLGLCLGYTFHWWRGKELFIKEFCIDRQYQGQGHGKRFLSELEEYLKANNLRAIWLSTERSVSAYHFYLANGFHELENSVFLAKNL